MWTGIGKPGRRVGSGRLTIFRMIPKIPSKVLSFHQKQHCFREYITYIVQKQARGTVAMENKKEFGK